ncbi:MAG: helix-hairpin-helix domain-containing protein, partial [Bacteroidia bacterium]|nr:helix-hairpin-helix domain-containing protein [Bacteroidia bacterium]
MKNLILPLIFSLNAFFLSAQNKQQDEEWMENVLELLLENQTVESDRSDLELSIKEWLKHPINLNKASKEDLESFFFLSPTQIQNILEHKEKHGDFLSIYELQAVKDLDFTDAYILSKFCYVNNSFQGSNLSLANKLKNGEHEIIIQQKRDFKLLEKESINYAGDLNYFSLRYRFQFKTNWYMGFGLEKDPGEKWNKYGDFQTFHF